ncbi:MAG TPA: hypothetical protein VLE21_05560 [Candidatus Nitrosocosmicus sp.]|nr:hypothetical protein [Candidatus Nitrosocosmicus sp.]
MNKLSDNAFTYGNMILLYCKFNPENLSQQEGDKHTERKVSYDSLPDFVKARIVLCVQTFNIIMGSKPDKFNTTIILITDTIFSQVIKDRLIIEGISAQYIEKDNTSKSIESVLNNVVNRVRSLDNPPTIYFVGSVWQKEVFDSIASSKFKDRFKILFEGALDHRPHELIQNDKLSEEPKKSSAYYKHKLTNKAIDTLLNYIFSHKKK